MATDYNFSNPFVDKDSLAFLSNIRKPSSTYSKMYEEYVSWIDNFVSQPNILIERKGAICPFVKKSLIENHMLLVVVETDNDNPTHGIIVMNSMIDSFIQCFPESDKLSEYKSLIVFFPNISDKNHTNFIENTHRTLKPTYVKHGLMLGKFHQSSKAGSVHNKNLKVMRSPMPFFAIRRISIHDIIFLDHPSYNDNQKIFLLNYYHDFLSAKLSKERRIKLKLALDQIRDRTAENDINF